MDVVILKKRALKNLFVFCLFFVCFLFVFYPLFYFYLYFIPLVHVPLRLLDLLVDLLGGLVPGADPLVRLGLPQVVVDTEVGHTTVHPRHVLLGLCHLGLSRSRSLLLGLASGGGLGGRSLTLLSLLLVAEVCELGLGGLGRLGGHRATVGRHGVLVGLKGLYHLLQRRHSVLVEEALGLEHGGHRRGDSARHLLAILAQGGIVLPDVGLEHLAQLHSGLDPPGGLTLGGIRVHLLGGLLGGLDGLALEAIGDGHNQVQPLLCAEALGHGNNLGDRARHFGL